LIDVRDKDESRHLLHRYAGWLDRAGRRGARVAAQLATLDFPPVTAELAARLTPHALSLPVAVALIRKAHDCTGREPRKALSLSQLAASIASEAKSPLAFPFASYAIEGQAWMRHAAALYQLGRFHDAKDAAEKADCFYAAAHPVTLRDAATLDLIRGKILHALGEEETALVLVDLSAKVILNVFNEPDKYVEAMAIYHALLMKSERYEQAAATWESIAALAREQGDSKLLAYILHNIGLTYLHARELGPAKECFHTAYAMFENLGLRAELPRVRGGIALALVQEGHYEAAIREMYKNRDAFLELGMEFDAATVMIRIVETRFSAGDFDEIPAICGEVLRFFEDAGLPREATKAAAYMLEAARRRALRIDQIKAIELFVYELKLSPDTSFLPPQ
jgi:tetratricopeptide (TPR) repeat protein